jgi:hypothetical protein
MAYERSTIRVLTVAAVLALLAACAQHHQPVPTSKTPEAPSAWTISAAGYGPVGIGMTPAEASAALGRQLLALNAETEESCSYVFPGGDVDASFAFMTAYGRIARVDVDQPGIATDAGAEVGDSEAAALALYPTAEVQPHKYGDPQDHYLVIAAPDGAHALILETWDGKVSYIRAGKLPEAEYVEGCS